MDVDRIEKWLRKKQAGKAQIHLGIGVILAVASVPALIVTYAVIAAGYAMSVAWMGSTLGVLEGAVDYTGIASLLILGLCFPCYLKADHEALEKLSYTPGTSSNRIVTIDGHGSTVNPLAPDSMHSSVKIIVRLLFIAPAICFETKVQFSKFNATRSMNFADAARVIAFLSTHYQRVPYSEIIQEVPGIDPTRTFPDLAKVDGVVVLTSEPAGLSLNDQLRSELKQFEEEV